VVCGLSGAVLTSASAEAVIPVVWHWLLVWLSPLSTLCLRLLRDDRDREILALRQQVLPPIRAFASC